MTEDAPKKEVKTTSVWVQITGMLITLIVVALIIWGIVYRIRNPVARVLYQQPVLQQPVYQQPLRPNISLFG